MAKDLSHLSDEDLAQAAGVQLSGHSDEDLAKIAGVDLPERTLGQKALGALGTAGEFIDRFTGAPTRAGIVTGVKSHDPLEGLKAFVSQIGAPADTAPTDTQTREAIGIPDFPGADLLTGVAADWTNVVPGLGLAKKGLTAAKEASGLGKAALEIPALVSKVPSARLAEGAEKLAIKQAGGQAKVWRELLAKNKDRELGRFLIDNKLVKTGDTVEDVYTKAKALENKLGQDIGSHLGNLTKSGMSISGEEAGGAMLDALTKELGSKELGEQAISKLYPLVERGATKVRNPGELVNFRREIDDLLRESTWNKPKKAYTNEEKGLVALRNSLNDLIDKKAGEFSVVNKKAAEALRESNRNYSLATKAREMAQNRLAQTNKNMTIGALDYLTGIGGASSSLMSGAEPTTAALMGLASAGGSMLARKYGAGLGMGALDTLSKVSKYSGFDHLHPMLPYLRRGIQEPSLRRKAMEEDQ